VTVERAIALIENLAESGSMGKMRFIINGPVTLPENLRELRRWLSVDTELIRLRLRCWLLCVGSKHRSAHSIAC
jgi:hypothetical protein